MDFGFRGREGGELLFKEAQAGVYVGFGFYDVGECEAGGEVFGAEGVGFWGGF